MHQRRFALRQPLHFAIVQPDAVGQHGAAAQQIVVVIDVEVAAPIGKQLPHPGHFLLVLGDVGVNVNIRMLPRQAPGARELLGRGGGREAWRDRILQAGMTVPAFDQRLRIGVARCRGVSEVVGAIAIHHHFAGDQPHAAGRGGCEDRIDRGAVHAAHDERRRGAVAQELGDEEFGYFARVLRIGKGALGREGMALQPFEQPLAVGADDVGLHEMGVRIDEARHDELAGAIGDRCVPRQGRQQFWCVADLANMPVLDDQQTVVVEFERAGGIGVGGIVQEVKSRSPERLSPAGGRFRAHC